MEGIKIEIGERERRRRGGDVSRNVSPPTTTTANGRRGRLRCCTHTLGISVKLNPKYFLIVVCKGEEGRKENLSHLIDELIIHQWPSGDGRIKRIREKMDTCVRTTCSPTYLPSPLEKEEESKRWTTRQVHWQLPPLFISERKRKKVSLHYEVVHQPSSSNRQHTITPPTTTVHHYKFYKKRGETFFSTFFKNLQWAAIYWGRFPNSACALHQPVGPGFLFSYGSWVLLRLILGC